MTHSLRPFNARNSLQANVELLEKEFELDSDSVNIATAHFLDRIRLGLRTQQPWQLPAYVTKIPDGSEKGTFLAIDLGGTNCRICLVSLHGDSTFTVAQVKYPVAQHLRVNSSHKHLFAFIAEKLEQFLNDTSLHEQSGQDTSHRLGFTFSFACDQTSIARGTLIHWDKGWNIPDAIGRDPCIMLQEAIDDVGLPVAVCVLANDSVGTLLTRAYTTQCTGPTLAGVIFGTGTNAAYVERLKNVTRLSDVCVHHASATEDAVMVINTEWGCFDDDMKVLPTTEFDEALDAESENPGQQMLEKRVSGLYLGELFRLAVLRLVDSGALGLTLERSTPVLKAGSIDSSFLSVLARDQGNEQQRTRAAIADVLGARGVTMSDAKLLRGLARAIVRRAARLAGAALAAIVLQSRLLNDEHVEAKKGSEIRSEEIAPKRRNAVFSVLSSLCASVSRTALRLFQCLGFCRDVQPSLPGKDAISSVGDLIDIGVDGSLIEFYPGFETEIRQALREVVDIGPVSERRITIGLAKDGSGVGAALMAQAAMLNTNTDNA